MKATAPTPDPETDKPVAAGADRSRLLREMFLNASLLAAMKEVVSEAANLDGLERLVARIEEEAISAPAA